jgi:hypothetical protein
LQYNPSGIIKKPNEGHQSDTQSPAHVNTQNTEQLAQVQNNKDIMAKKDRQPTLAD